MRRHEPCDDCGSYEFHEAGECIPALGRLLREARGDAVLLADFIEDVCRCPRVHLKPVVQALINANTYRGE